MLLMVVSLVVVGVLRLMAITDTGCILAADALGERGTTCSLCSLALGCCCC